MSRKAMFVGLVAVVLAMAAPSFAQGPFADVPVDHWAYEAVSQLQEKGIVIGYPDGTFGGKRAMTRYEFALALSRAMPVICDMCQTQPVNLSGYATKQELQDAIKGITPGGGPGPVSAADMDALKKSVNEFRDELSGMGVDLDAVKRDVASLEERVAAIEAEMKRLKVTTKLTFFAAADKTRDSGYVNGSSMPAGTMYSGAAYDRDSRRLNDSTNLLENLAVVRDADVIFNFQGGDTRAKVVLNAGNYLGDYLDGYLSDFTGWGRWEDDDDDVSLFMAYGEMPFLGADVAVGRFPIQFTKWTLKKFDVDSYTENWKTDDGNYYVDGIKGAWNWGAVDILAFAGKNSGNDAMYTLTSRSPVASPFSYMADEVSTSIGMIPSRDNDENGYPVTQSIGARMLFNLGSAKVGANWIKAGAENDGGVHYDSADVYGGDLEIPLGSWKLAGAYTVSDSNGYDGTPDQNKENDAWEAGLSGNLGSLGLCANYKDIAPNFSAPGDWDRLGRWQNPVNIKGPSVGMKWAAGDRWSFTANGAWYDIQESDQIFNTGGSTYSWPDGWKIEQYKGAINMAVGAKGAIGLEGEWVKWKPAGSGGDPLETYCTLSYSHLVSDNAKLRLLYQIVEYKDKGAGYSPYGSSYKGDVAVAQVSMDF